MSIKFNVVEKPQPGVAGGGVKKWYASAKVDGEFTVDELTKEIEKFSALSEADIRGVIIALENVIINQIVNGKIVRLDKLGSFYPSLSSEGSATEASFNTSLIKAAKMNYRPGARIADALKTAKFQKVK
ncbi:HU family DNA-binding protein [Empedobacter brevis]|uniref:HU family DNA-binding protein n=1 Tax=Empedobacter brevis TaxID=247 RepID=UPI0039AFDA90